MTTRPSWDTYFLGIACVVAQRATCDRKHVGAVIVKDQHILSTGYNGSPPGHEHCDEVGHELIDIAGRPSCQRTIHAEQNAIFAAAKYGSAALQGATLYVTTQPCLNCAKSIIAAGIASIVYEEKYGGAVADSAAPIFQKAGVDVRHQPLSEAQREALRKSFA